MGTEVLYPQDCLPHRLRHAPSSSFLPRRKPHKAHAHRNPNNNPNPNPNPNHNHRSNHLLNNFNANPNPKPCRKAEAKTKREVTQPVMGQVTILKRGESLDEKTSRALSKEKKRSGSGGGVLSSEGGGDLIVVERRQLRIPVPGIYAGSVCSLSPSPSALPLPTFSTRKGQQTCAAQAASVDLSATEDLRRLLRLG